MQYQLPDRAVEASFPLTVAGKYQLEVIGDGATGPVVVSNVPLFVTQGLTADQSQVDSIYKKVDQQVMNDAVYLPFLWDKSLDYRNPRLTNIYLQAGLGYIYDYVNLGTSDGK